ncbi:MAG TPA: ATP-binding cassette domain-containing protein, partial [Acidimicrobiales bacterium]|nr:ATP-binding cassette domain-containing protein [Acidimicrobiales bacterium]
MAVLVDVEKVSAARPGRPLFTDLSLTVADGDRVGIVGINGTGKSTLLRLLAGVEHPESGSVRFGRGVRIGWLDQSPRLPDGTALAAVGTGWAAGEITVAEQYLATAVAGRLVSRLGALTRHPGRSRGTVVFGAPSGERHSLA